MCGLNFTHRQRLVDDRTERTRGELVEHVFGELLREGCLLVARTTSQDRAVNRSALCEERAEVEVALRPTHQPDDDDPPSFGEHFHVLAQIRGADGIENHVRTLGGGLEDLHGESAVGNQHGVIEAEIDAALELLSRTRRADHRHAQSASDLDPSRSDAACHGVEQDRLTSLELSLKNHRVVSGEKRLGDGGGFFEGQRLGHAHQLVCLGDDQLGHRTAAEDAHDAVADGQIVDIAADRFDRSRKLETGDVLGDPGGGRVEAPPLQTVRAVEAGGRDTDTNLSGTRIGNFDVAEVEDLRPSRLADDDCPGGLHFGHSSRCTRSASSRITRARFGVMTANVGGFLYSWARREPSRSAIIDAAHGDAAYTYEELDRRAASVSAHLIDHGLGPKSRVAVCTDNGLEFVAAWFGAVYAGCTTLPIPAMSTAREVAFRLQHAGCAAILCDDAHLPLAEQAIEQAGTRAAILRVSDADRGQGESAEPFPCEPGDLAMILYTSGTTGAAKGVCITHESLLTHTSILVGDTLQLTADDRILGALPLTHSYGIRMTLLVPFCAGASTVFTPRFSASHTLKLCARHRVTWLPGVPTMFVAWAEGDSPSAPLALRWCLSAGAPLLEDIRLRAEAQLGATVRQGYGLTEATFSTINAPPDDAVPQSVGKPVDGVEVRIETDDGNIAKTGMRGEVLIRGHNVMAGYLDDRTATAHAMRGGWLHTGDVGFLDRGGRLTIVDRSKDLILRGGHSVYPFEVEDALAAHPAIADVAVVGIADDYYGEEIVAVVIAHREVELHELDSWARERIAPYKVPRRYAFARELPHGASGKTLKRVLRDRLADGSLPSQAVKAARAG